MWIPRRTAYKKLFPLCLDVSVGGHVSSGENYDEAFARELNEELNIGIEDVVWKENGYFKPHDHNVSSFMKVYEISTDETPMYNPNDFIGAFWIKP